MSPTRATVMKWQTTIRIRPAHRIRARPARGDRGESKGAHLQRDHDIVAAFLDDAAHFPDGHAEAVATPSSEAEIAAVLASSSRVLAIGAQSSLTGGATPMGDVLISTSKLNRILSLENDSVRVQAGVTLSALDAALML